jgi:class 3 adenylate cyclase/CHASE2 domain-containing sensor protein
MKLNNSKKQFISSLGSCILASFLAFTSVHYLSFFKNLENIAEDIRIAAFSPKQEQSKEIVIVAINEATLEQFQYRSPIDREFIAKLLKTLDKKGAKVIGLDILLDQPTEQSKDLLLKKTIGEIKKPLFISYSVSPEIVNENQLEYMNEFVPQKYRATANMASDPFDGSIRWIYPGEKSANEPMGFARKALELLQIETPNKLTKIAWRPKPNHETSPFPIYPANTIQVLPDAWFTDKIVLIGAVLSITDRHKTPLAVVGNSTDEAMMPGILIHAHSISQLLNHQPEPGISIESSILITFLGGILGMLISFLKKGLIFNVVMGMLIVVLWWVGSMLGYQYGMPLVPLLAPTLSLGLSIWMMDILIGKAERKQRQFVQGAFSRYVSPEVVRQLVATPEALSISGKKTEVSFIFTDIAGFTTLSEKLSSESLSNVLNEYLDGACQIILKHGGTIDKFIGDAIMCLFNAPIEQNDHAMRAVTCAKELDHFAEAFRKEQNLKGIPIGITRIGVHTGLATVGNFGSNTRMDYTALGDTVNTAARTEGVNKYFGTRICCTQSTVSLVPDLLFRKIGDVVLKGKYESVGLFTPVLDEELNNGLFKEYLNVYQHIEECQDHALLDLEKAMGNYPNDSLFHFYLDRLNSGIQGTKIVMEDK